MKEFSAGSVIGVVSISVFLGWSVDTLLSFINYYRAFQADLYHIISLFTIGFLALTNILTSLGLDKKITEEKSKDENIK